VDIPQPLKRALDDLSDAENSEDSLQPIAIETILTRLHVSMPAFNFPQYQAAMVDRGICYAANVVDFDWGYYVEKVGMADGAARELVRSVKRMLSQQKREFIRAQKRAKENVGGGAEQV
jgi:hypothetical protein